MSVKEDVKQLLAKEGKTMTWLAVQMTQESGKKYTMKSIELFGTKVAPEIRKALA